MVPLPALVALLAMVSAAEPPPRVIAKIEIVVRDVFEDANGKLEVFPYGLANRLHIDTRERVIRRELLFAEGDVLEEEALAQSERNLRRLSFLRGAEIVTTSVEDGEAVEVRVVTSDSWTTAPEVRLSKVGNVWVWALGGSEKNLFGLGKHLEVLRSSSIDRDQTSLFYVDPRLLGSRFRLAARASDASDGHHYALSAERPFFALDTLWGFRLAAENFDRADPLYKDGERLSELRHQRERTEVAVGRSVYRSDTAALRLHVSYQHALDDVEVERREFGIAQVGVTSVRHAFRQFRYLNRFEKIEDVNLGNQAAAFVGVSNEALGGEPGDAFFFFLSERKGFAVGSAGFMTGHLSWQARHRAGALENVLSRARLDLVLKPSRRQALLAKADLRYGRDLDPEIQIRLGAESGLKGYPVRQFVGDRSLLTAVEGRWFVADDVARLLSLGLAAFVESGFAWPEGQPMTLSDLRSDVGASLLLGLSRASATHPGVRIDLAYALHPVAGRGRWLLSAGSQVGF